MYVNYQFIKLWLQADDLGITEISFVTEPQTSVPVTKEAQKHLELAKDELLRYFEGKLHHFTVPIHFTKGTPFQQRVWNSLLSIPYGEIKSYQEIAVLSESPKAQQAVGQANRNNPIPIIVPCHRVIGKSGKLVGYSGSTTDGLITKKFLLDLEQKNSQ